MPLKNILFFSLSLLLLSLSVQVIGAIKKKGGNKVEIPPPPKKQEDLKIDGNEGQMTESEKCPGVKCFEPNPSRSCTPSNNETSTVPAPTSNCCVIYICQDANGQSVQYSASTGTFESGPPPGFVHPGLPPGSFPGPQPGFPYGPPQQQYYGPPPVMMMPREQMPNYNYQQNSRTVYQKGPGSESNANSNSHSSSSSYSFSYGGPNGNNNTNNPSK